ncbi:MAG: hypothetical protein ACRDKW_13540 [Actinomycetota bacterium]
MALVLRVHRLGPVLRTSDYPLRRELVKLGAGGGGKMKVRAAIVAGLLLVSVPGIAHAVGGGAGDDRIIGTFGNNVLRGGYGDDYLRGNDGNDVIYGGPGADVIRGGRGVDDCFIDGRDVIVRGCEGILFES